jgi:hypothetical protein
MSESLAPGKIVLLEDIQKDINKLTLEGKLTDEQKKLYEQLVLNYSDPRQEWGRNNLRDLIVLFHESGQSADQIYNILYTMGVEKQTAYDGIQAYLPQKNQDIKMSTIAVVNVKEQINISDKIHSLIEKLNAFNSGDTLNYTVKTIVAICESYLQNDMSGLSAYDHSKIARGLVRELNQYCHIKPVSEAIKNIEDTLAENMISLELDGLYSKLANQNNNGYTTVIGKLGELKGLNESEIREKSKDSLKDFNYIPDVRLFLENVDLSLDNQGTTKISPVDGFNLRGRLRDLHESINKYEAPNSTYTVNTVKAICEKYINQLYKGNISVSESYIASNVARELESFMWLDMVKESIISMVKYINENIMSFEVNEALRKLRNMNGNNFYATAVTSLEEIRNLSESEVREKIKYNMQQFTWIPEIKYLIESVNNLENSLTSNTDAIVEKVYSPMMNIDGKNAFYLAGKIYSIDESKQLIEIDPRTATALYLTLITVTENFKFNAGSITYFKGNNSINIALTENGTAFKFNDKDIEIKESNDIRNFLLSNGSFGVNDNQELDMVVKAFENIDSFTELEFVQSIHSRMHKGIVVNVIRVNEDVYVNRVNPYMNTNETIKASTATDAIGLVKEYVNYDIKLSVVDLLQEEAKKLAILEVKKESLFDKIAFLKEQRSVLANQDKTIAYIAEADNLLASEIEKFEKELNELVK